MNRSIPLRSNPETTRAWKNRKGKRTLKRGSMNAELNKLGIQCCELRIEGRCLGRQMLTWAHATKSRFLVTDEDWLRAARACCPCHDFVESKSHAEMARIIDEAIALRNSRYFED